MGGVDMIRQKCCTSYPREAQQIMANFTTIDLLFSQHPKHARIFIFAVATKYSSTWQ